MITAAGIAGVVAFSVNQRTQEFGIRMALGAPRTGVLGMVVRQGLALVAIGLVIGMAGAILLTRLLTTLLFEIEPTDALTFLAVSTVLLMVAVVACLMPARRAASVDPIVALRALYRDRVRAEDRARSRDPGADLMTPNSRAFRIPHSRTDPDLSRCSISPSIPT